MMRIAKAIILFALLSVCSAANVPDANNKHQPEISTTHRSIMLHGKKLQYTAAAGFLPILNEANKTEGQMFFTAYFNDSGDSARPVVFAFNGGPGSSSVWLHLGCLGPKRVNLNADANTSPYALTDNQYTWLDIADVVLIDPIGTGFSYAIDPNEEKSFFAIHKDAESVASFIRTFLMKYHKWGSPKYLVGESYGTVRDAELLRILSDGYGIRIDGMVLISSVLNFETISFTACNDLPYCLYLPTYTAAAWYHKMLAKDLQSDFQKALNESKEWANSEYMLLLARGDNINDKDKKELSQRLQRYTGLSEQFIKNNNYRIEVFSFIMELLKNKGLHIGLMDSRFTSFAIPPDTTYYDDPSFARLQTIYVSAFNEYLSSELDFNSTKPYKSLSQKANRSWQWGSAENGFVDVTDELVKAIIGNNNLKVFVAMGYYDLTTPFRTQEYTIDHLGMTPQQRKNIQYHYYSSGHQIYAEEESLAKFRDDITAFFNAR